MDNIIIFDTTLRDGEQSPGASMTLNEKVRIAKALEKLNVDVIEAGFSAASEGDFHSVQAVARAITDCQVCSLCRSIQTDIERSAEAIKDAAQPRLHVFLATSKIHMEKKLQLSPEQVLERAVAAVKYARNFTDNVEFSPEDGGRSEIDFLCQIIEATIAAGATTINIPDTVGYTLPEEFGNIFHQVISRVPNSHKAIFSAHCHNDLGLAVANSMAAIANGARQIECTINGLGERAGNTALEEIVMTLKTRHNTLGLDTQINSQFLVPTSRLVSAITGFPIQPNKAIVGANAFAHESGIHQDGVLKDRQTYEIMLAEDVGWDSNRMVLGKHSGRAALKDRLAFLGYTVDSQQLGELLIKFKNLADKKHEVYDDDLHALMSDTELHDDCHLMSLEYANQPIPKAKVTVHIRGKEEHAEKTGDGVVDATFKAIESIFQSESELILYSVNNITGGSNAQGEVSVRLKVDDEIVNGQGSDTDIVTASAKAYLNALNRLESFKQRANPQKMGI